jgi:subtilisin-like proprotein convertase family protein
MKKKLLYFFVMIFATISFYAQNNYWNSENAQSLDKIQIIKQDFQVKGDAYFSLNKQVLSDVLSTAPMRYAESVSNVLIQLPVGKDKYETYEVFSTSTMSPELSASYPKIKSYVGRSIDKTDASTVRITITPQGLYAMILKPEIGQIFINPIDINGNYYMVFKKENASSIRNHICEVTDNTNFTDQVENFDNQTYQVDDSTLRTYRLALACTGEYSQFHINQAGVSGGTVAQQTAAVLAAMVVAVDRVNQIYERDMSISFQLIPNNDQIIFLDAVTDPYTNNNGGAMLGQNQTTIDNIIGFSNYDIGHVFSTGGGGIAALGSVCSSFKARGVTGSPFPVGDPFVIDFVCHEIGHQFDATHTQNNDCQRTASTAVEPGSGSTIMGYAGICPPNVQNNSDTHFHQISLNQMFNYISSGGGSSCGSFTSIANTPPTITPEPNYTIPNGTAFYLDATATDAENDALTYNWEQINNQVSTQPPLPTSTVGPNFRSLPSKSESRRYFPDFQEVLNNNLTPQWEVVPSVARSMNFALTVRDNNILGGQSKREIVSVNFANVGPFEVTSQNTDNISWQTGETRTITWNVAGTTANGINTSNVNILLSTDNGQTFTPLVSNTPNDGTEDIVVPDVQGGFCRIMVEAVGNVFYALNSNLFSINTTVSTICNDYVNTTSVAIPDGLGANQQGPAVSSVINIPDNITNISDVNVTLDVSHTYVSDLVFQMQAPNGDIIVLWSRNCNSEDGFTVVFNDNGPTLPTPGTTCANPLTGSYAPASTSTDLATVFSNGTAGDWTLAFADFYNGDIGSLNSWEIEICSTTFSVEDNQLNDFVIYPNPNNGSFTLSLNNGLSNEAKLHIYDIQGKLVESVNLSNAGSTQQVQLKNAYEAGVYLAELVSDNVKTVNKLIIK